ncbi:MAG: peptide deformylase [Acidimicrobiia bacterium]|nr:peptide deformylase [Acidimicrobiia bacterium]
MFPEVVVAIFPIRTFGDPVLRTRAERVEKIDEGIHRLVDDMFETMYDAPGVGLAAPQIGVSRQVIVFDAGDGPHVLINPELVEMVGEWSFEEGCLSVPGRFWPIARPGFARARGLDLEGRQVEYAGDELMGRILQHEVDHLAGVLLIERLDQKLRKQALRDLRDEALGFGSG